ncbi:MAG: hypothetical protein AMXMBFR72_13040 [Betaproteobacteria bacterium]
MNTVVHARAVDDHYGRADLATTILQALQAAGKDPDRLAPEDLAPVDQFHSRGIVATLELAERAGLAAGTHVLDVGGGLGGAARTLARRIGCRVTVLDLTREYCHAGALLTARCGLAERVRFECGSALAMPFADAAFDAAWSQHSSMNIADKPRLYGEIARVLKRGGTFALHEIAAGPRAPVHFPVPWARTPEISHLVAPDELRALVVAAGFAEREWIDETDRVLDWFARGAAAAAGGALPPLGLHVLLGPDFGAMFANQVRNLNEERIRVVQGVFERR